MLRFLTAGESHGPSLIAIVEGIPAGLALSEEAINHDLRRRQGGYGRGGRMSIERDRVEILGGLAKGRTTGAPLALCIANRDWLHHRGQEESPVTVPRPGHADLAGALKYGLTDLRLVAERASARETAARVAVGAVAKALLDRYGISIYSYVISIGEVAAAIPVLEPARVHALAEASPLRCPNPDATAAMMRLIDAAHDQGESLGGVFEVVAVGVPAGLGSYVHWDRRMDGLLAQAVMSIPAIKGVEIGDGFASARRPGTQTQDEILLAAEGERKATAGSDGEVGDRPAIARQHEGSEGRFCLSSATRCPLTRPTNRCGGIEGGVTNGQPIVIRAAMKPIPTTLKPQRSVDLATCTPAATRYQRSDVCAVPAASIVAEAMVAWVLAGALLERYGGDTIQEVKAGE